MLDSLNSPLCGKWYYDKKKSQPGVIQNNLGSGYFLCYKQNHNTIRPRISDSRIEHLDTIRHWKLFENYGELEDFLKGIF